MISAHKTARLTGEVAAIPQLGIGQILLLFAWPVAWYTILIYAIGRQFINAAGTIPTWVLLSTMVLGPGAELAVGWALLRQEGLRPTMQDLRGRIGLNWPSGRKAWAIAIVVFVLAMAIGMLMGPVNRALAAIPGFGPPAWWPAGSNPLVTVKSAADAFPDITLKGNYGFVLLYLVIGLVFNIVGEEFYYRGVLLPRMKGAFGRYDWIANGVLFTLKHAYQRWQYPGIAVGAFAFAFAAGPMGSLPLAMVYHWCGNFLLQTISLVQALFGG